MHLVVFTKIGYYIYNACAFLFKLEFVLLLLACFLVLLQFSTISCELLRKYFDYWPTNIQKFLSEINTCKIKFIQVDDTSDKLYGYLNY